MEVVFSDRGFAVDVLPDGIEALDLRQYYDVILLDLNMPVFDGERLTDYWSLTNPGALERLIVMTGYSHFTQHRHLPVFATIAKPFEIARLTDAVDECVRVGRRTFEEECVRIPVTCPESGREPEGEL